METLGLIMLIILSVLVLFIILCLFVKVRLVFTASKGDEEALGFSVHISLFGGKFTRMLFPGKSDPPDHKKDKKTKKKENSQPEENSGFFQKVSKYYKAFLKIKYTYIKSKPKIRRNISVDRFMLNLKFGMDDAAQTGMATGALWAGVYNVVAFVAGIVRLTEPEITITPDYERQKLEFEFESIMRFRLVNIINVLITLGINYYFINKKLTKKEKAAINYGNTN